MSTHATFTLPRSDPPCSVHLPENGSVTQEELLSFPAFKTWISTLQHSLSLQRTVKHHPFHTLPYSLRSITIQNVDKFGGGKLGFVKLRAEVSNDEGEKLPGIAFLRGGSVSILILLRPDDTTSEEEQYVLLTLQPRIPAGSLSFAELPAGMLDEAGTFSGAAAKEIVEETGLEIPQDQLLDMTSLTLSSTTGGENEKLQNGIYPSPGGSDEFIPIFLYRRKVTRAQLEEWSGKLTGLRDEGEKITLKCVPLANLWKEAGRDAKALCALTLYQGLKHEGTL